MGLLLAGSVLLASHVARASGPYVTIQDDGSVQNALDADAKGGTSDPTVPLLALYSKTGFPVPQVLSVWTTFPMDGEIFSTFFFPESNDVKGVGLEQYGLPKASFHPPLEDALFHNDVLQIAARASRAGAPAEGYAQYLFLLELSHKWCGNTALPPSDAGAALALVGFPFHWSFWMDAGGSPCGGNAWIDNHDGTFTVAHASPSTVKYSMFDLYLMGLAAADEVKPFGVLESPVPPSGITDGLWGGPYAAHSFPWFGAATFTAQAPSERAVSVDDIVTANGLRSPAYGAAPTTFTVGFVLLASKSDTPASIASAKTVFDPIATSLAPAFSSATRMRGTIDVVTAPPAMDAGAGARDAGSPPDAGSRDAGARDASTAEAASDAGAPSRSSGGCSLAHRDADGRSWMLALLIVLRRRRRADGPRGDSARASRLIL
jgi:hypothetical protein